MELAYTIFITIVTLAVLVIVHELGHFWVARRCGVKVLRFSVGFGTPLFRWSDRTGTEYVVAALPLGGYVKMLDEREGEVNSSELDQAFNRKPAKDRIAIAAAGPLANFLLAIAAYWFVMVSGVSGIAPIIGSVEQGSIAEIAGLEAGQEIIAVDGQQTPTREALNMHLVRRLGESGGIRFAVKYPDSDVIYESEAELHQWLSDQEAPDLMAGLGIKLFWPTVLAVVDQVVEDSPAALAGLQSGDLIVSANGEPMADWLGWVEYVRARPGQPMTIDYERENTRFQTQLTPVTKHDEQGQAYGQVGVSVQWPEWPEDMKRRFNYGPVEAVVAAADKTWTMTVVTLESLKKMLEGLISPKNLSGPITIAKVATASANTSLEAYISFLAFFSVSLGVLNLLPIPVLDGGHILYCLVELVTGRPVSERVQVVGFQIGLFIIISVMLLAFYNDLMRL